MTKPTKEYIEANFHVAVDFARRVRAEFGDGVRLVGASENGLSVGRKYRPVVGNVDIVIYPDYSKKPDKSKKGRKK